MPNSLASYPSNLRFFLIDRFCYVWSFGPRIEFCLSLSYLADVWQVQGVGLSSKGGDPGRSGGE